jgi:hypothetical protein
MVKRLKTIITGFLLTAAVSSFAQDSIPRFFKHLRISQSFTYISQPDVDEYNYPINSIEAYWHTRASLHIFKNLGFGYNYTRISAWGTYYDLSKYFMHGPFLLYHNSGNRWVSANGRPRKMVANLELGLLWSDFIVTLEEPKRRNVNYVATGMELNYFFRPQVFLKGGYGVTTMLQNEPERMQQVLFYYRLGIGFQLNLEKGKPRQQASVRNL